MWKVFVCGKMCVVWYVDVVDMLVGEFMWCEVYDSFKCFLICKLCKGGFVKFVGVKDCVFFVLVL